MDKHLRIALILSAVDKASSVISNAVNKSSRNLEKIGRSARIQEQMDSVGNRALLAGAAVTGFFASTLGAASSLEESLSKTRVVFGENSDAVIRWAENSAVAFGQSQQDALEAASTYGNLFQAFGVGRQQAQEMSTTLTQLAADLASFNNTSVEEAIIALRSGLSGETEPLKRFGVAINDVRLKDQALRMGLISTTKGALEPGIKAQAAFALIMHDTALAQGDFARTSDGFANSQRIARAELANTTAQLGAALIPAVTQLLKAVLPVIQAFARWAKENPGLVKTIAAGGVALLALGGALKIASAAMAIFNAVALLNPIGLIVAAVIAAIAAITALVVYWEDLVAWFKQTSPLMKVVLAPLIAALGPLLLIAYAIRQIIDNWGTISQFFVDIWNTADQTFTKILGRVEAFVMAVPNAFQAIYDYLAGLWERFYQAGANIVNSIAEGMKSAAMAPINAMEAMVGKMRDYLPFSPAKTGPLRDIHRVKIVETIASSMKPQKLTEKMGQVVGAATNMLGGGMGVSAPAMQLAPVGGGGSSFNYAPQITINGADPQAQMNFREILNQHKDEILRILRMENERSSRTRLG